MRMIAMREQSQGVPVRHRGWTSACLQAGTKPAVRTPATMVHLIIASSQSRKPRWAPPLGASSISSKVHRLHACQSTPEVALLTVQRLRLHTSHATLLCQHRTACLCAHHLVSLRARPHFLI
jgi:hypothetical protein